MKRTKQQTVLDLSEKLSDLCKYLNAGETAVALAIITAILQDKIYQENTKCLRN